MSNLTPPSQSNTLLTNIAKVQATTNVAAPSNVINAGTPINIAAVNPTQILLATQSGKVAVPIAKDKHNLLSGQEFVAQTRNESGNTLLTLANKYLQQQVSLNKTESNLLIQKLVQSPPSNIPAQSLKAQVVAIAQNQIQLNVGGAQLSVNVPDSSRFKVGQWIELKLENIQGQFQSSIKTTATKTSTAARAEIPINLNQQQQQQLIGISLRQGSKVELTQNQLGLVADIKTTFLANQDLKAASKVIIETGKSNQLQLTANWPDKPAVQLNLNQNQRSLIQQLGIDLNSVPTSSRVEQSPLSTLNKEALNALLQNKNIFPDAKSIIENKPVSDLTRRDSSLVAKDSSITRQASVPDNQSGLNKATQKLLQQYQQLVDTPKSESSIKLLEQVNNYLRSEGKANIGTKELESILRTLGQNVQPTAPAFPKLSQALTNYLKELQSLSIAPELKSKLESLVKQTLQDIGTSSTQPPEAQLIKQIVQSPALSLPVNRIQSISNQSGFVAGLISLLQVSLASRMAQKQPKAMESFIQSLLPGIAAVATDKKGSVLTKPSRDLANLEKKLGLLNLASEAIGDISQQKIKNAETRIQGQEALHLILPFFGTEQKSPVELLIQREQDKNDNKEGGKANPGAWLLTMKLSIGDLGEVLAKSNLQGQELKIDFVTTSEQLKEMVFQFAPFLKKRFEQLGIQMDMNSCQRGEIPGSLALKPYQLFQAQA